MSTVDSRQYRISFEIEAISQVPADFVLPSDLATLDAGVFLPRGDADWLGRRRYPARILLLSGREALVATHPEAGEQPVRVLMDRIESIEWGRILLVGWIVLNWGSGLIRLPYNTRSRAPIEKFMQALLDRWLPEAPARETASAGDFGDALDLKFEYALSAELLPGEAILARFFQPPPSGDLVLVTSRRLLWITERRNGRYERYGAVSYSAGLTSIADVRGGGLVISLRDGESWHIPIRKGREQEAGKFARQLEGGFSDATG
jgi:hypothetical protein